MSSGYTEMSSHTVLEWKVKLLCEMTTVELSFRDLQRGKYPENCRERKYVNGVFTGRKEVKQSNNRQICRAPNLKKIPHPLHVHMGSSDECFPREIKEKIHVSSGTLAAEWVHRGFDGTLSGLTL